MEFGGRPGARCRRALLRRAGLEGGGLEQENVAALSSQALKPIKDSTAWERNSRSNYRGRGSDEGEGRNDRTELSIR